jgi:hypothetical protein
MSLSSNVNRYASMSKSQLIAEIARLRNQLRSKDSEIGLLKERIAIYRSLS